MEEDILPTSPPHEHSEHRPQNSTRATQPDMPPDAVPRKKHEELVRKLKLLAAQRANDRAKITELDKYREEAEPYMQARHKLRAKLIELQNELNTLRKQNRENEHEKELAMTRQNEYSDQLEMTNLDKEVAEEKLVQSQASVSALTEKIAELEVTVKVLQENGAGNLDQAVDVNDPNVPTDSDAGIAWVQMSKQNERLKDALTKLRDMSSESEAVNKKRITELEKELDTTADLQDAYENVARKLEEAESHIEHLKLQLDDAMGAEDILEQLTERNLSLSERLDEMRTTVQDLEALKELNDELEESHFENEKQLQQELDLREYQLRESRQRCNAFEDNIVDYENTIVQFRDLVMNLQADIDTMREQENNQKNQTQALTDQSQAILNMNMKLQSTVHKGHIKAIDMELKKLDAIQASNRLDIVKAYLPTSFFETDGDAVDALLFFERLAFKAGILSSTMEQAYNISEALDSHVEDQLVIVCETRGKLAAFSGLTNRIAANLRRCDPETFMKMGHIYRELLNIEKKLDAFLDAIGKEELKESDCGKEIDMLLSQAAHVAETQLGDSGLDLSEQHLGHIVTIDMSLDTISAGIGFCITAVNHLVEKGEMEFLIKSGDDLESVLLKPLRQIFDRSRSCKVVSRKLHRRVEELTSSSQALSPETAEPLGSSARSCHKLGSACVKIVNLFQHYLEDIRGNAFDTELFDGIVQEAMLDFDEKVATTSRSGGIDDGGSAGDAVTNFATERVDGILKDVYGKLTKCFASSGSEHVYHATFESPWRARVAEIESSSAANIDAQRRMIKMNEDMRDLTRDLRSKDQQVQEGAMKVEIMEKRMEAAKKQGDTITELEGQLNKAKVQEKTYEEALETLQNDLDRLEQDNIRLKQAPSTAEKQPGDVSTQSNVEYIPFTGSLETSQLVEQMESLRGTARFLKAENRLLKSNKLLSELSPLPTYSQATRLTKDPSFFSKSNGTEAAESTTEDDSSIYSRIKNLKNSTNTGEATTTTTSARDEKRGGFELESKLLMREALAITCSPRVIDLSEINKVPDKEEKQQQRQQKPAKANSQEKDESKSELSSTRKELKPERQLYAQKKKMHELMNKVESLRDKIGEQNSSQWNT